MKTTILSITLAITLMLTVNVFAQDPSHVNYYKEIPVIIETNYGLKLSDIVAKMEYAKMQIEIENKTTDFLVYFAQETGFKYEHSEYHPDKKPLIIKPMSSKTRTLKVDDDTRFHADGFTLDFRGLYSAALKGNEQEAPEFQLPTAVNEFDAGPFHIKCLKVKQETQETEVQFKCTYNGEMAGIVNPANLAIKIENGTEFANDNKRSKAELLLKGEDTKFVASFHIPGKIVDMQFATMHIQWKNTFTESELKPQKNQTLTIEVDPGMTAGKNK